MIQEEELLEVFRTYLPKYLSPEQQASLTKRLYDDFPSSSDSNKVFCRLPDENVFLQGDGIEDIPFSRFSLDPPRFEIDFRDGVLISNTCDISPENQRLSQANASFVAIYPLASYLSELQLCGITQDRIRSFEQSLRANHITNLMYLPPLLSDGHEVLGESFMRFDQVTCLPAEILDSKYDRKYAPMGNRWFSLSQYGFFLFILKLSVHFCRFRENVVRSGF
jgi:hypothetical protein